MIIPTTKLSRTTWTKEWKFDTMPAESVPIEEDAREVSASIGSAATGVPTGLLVGLGLAPGNDAAIVVDCVVLTGLGSVGFSVGEGVTTGVSGIVPEVIGSVGFGVGEGVTTGASGIVPEAIIGSAVTL